MKKALRWLGKGLLLLLGILAIFLLGSTAVFHLKSGQAQAVNPVESRLKGQSCDLWEDPQGISHARAARGDVATACLGYFHGRDRSWQMDFFRRTWQGRKSEVLGASEVRSDFTMRLLDLQNRADAIFSKMPAARQEQLWAYTYGVNRGFEEAKARGIYEFKALGYEAEPWRPQDSVALLLLQGFDQTKESFVRQIDESDFAGDWGDEAAKLFRRPGVPWDTTVLKPGEQVFAAKNGGAAQAGADRGAAPGRGVNASSTAALAKQMRADWGRYSENAIGQGSNNWVLAPSRSASGHAWLANDPHLELKHPPFWYWLHIESPEADMIGASLPGIPGIASGANRHLAWGVTNSYLNVSRLAFVPEGDLAADTRSERPLIWIKWGPLRIPFLFKSLRRTSEGWPLLPLEAPEGSALVLRWSGFELGPEDFEGVFELPAAKNAAQADRALSRFGVPSWNFVFADDTGKIGYRAVGKVPGNPEALPFGISSMSLSAFRALPAFRNYLTPAEMPHLMNPSRGFVATANNRQWPEPDDWRIGRAHSEGFRAFRIEELLLLTPKHDLDSIRKVQCDVQAVDARFLLRGLLRSVGAPGDARGKRAIEALKSWDFIAGVDCKACPIFQRWVDRLLTDQDLDDSSLYRKLETDDPEFKQAVHAELTGALDDLHVGPDGPLPSWGELHLNYFQHLAGKDEFPAKPIATPGDDQSVDPGSSEWEDGIFRHTTGASQRLIVELASPPRVYSVLAGSNADVEHRDLSAPGSEWRRWLDCEQQRREFPLDWSKVQARRLVW